jgi:hypothetical protein
LDQFLTMRYNTGLTTAPASPLYGSPVCKRSPIQVLTVLNAASVIEGTGAFNIAYGRCQSTPRVYQNVVWQPFYRTDFEKIAILFKIWSKGALFDDRFRNFW